MITQSSFCQDEDQLSSGLLLIILQEVYKICVQSGLDADVELSRPCM